MWHSDVTFGWCQRCFVFAKNHGFFRGFPRLLRYWILHCIRVQLRALWFPCLRKSRLLFFCADQKNQARFDPLEFWEVVFLRKHVDVFIVQRAIVLYSEHGRCSNNLTYRKAARGIMPLGSRNQHTNSHQSWVIKGFSIFSTKEEDLFKCP